MKTEWIISLSIALLGTALFTVLLACHLIGQVAFVTLIGMLALLCLVVPGLRRLKQLDLKNLKMTLDKIEKAKEEVFAKEENLTKVSLLASQLIAFNSAFEGRAHDDESYRLQNEWFCHKIKELLAAVHASPETIAEVLKYFHAFRKLDGSAGDTKKRCWQNLMDMIREDIGEPRELEHPVADYLDLRLFPQCELARSLSPREAKSALNLNPTPIELWPRFARLPSCCARTSQKCPQV